MNDEHRHDRAGVQPAATGAERPDSADQRHLVHHSVTDVLRRRHEP